MTNRPDLEEAGFSLVEVLVAVAIISGLIMGIGALITNVAELSSRTEATSRIMAALIEVNTLRGLAGAEIAVTATRPTSIGFDLEPQPGGQRPPVPRKFFLNGAGAKVQLEYASGDARAAVDLSIFEAISIEYFVPSAQTLLWQDTPLDSAIAGARLVLRYGARVWRPLIWMRSEYR